MQAALNDRQITVLEGIVASHILRGTPIGSRYVSRNSNIGLSPASIRSVMAELEKRGFLAKPHVSAGRIPTDRGYRVYVDKVMRSSSLRGYETRAISRLLDPGRPVAEVLQRVSKLLQTLSQKISVILMPGVQNGIVTRLDTVQASAVSLLVTISCDPGRERTISIKLESRKSLLQTAALLRKVAGLIVGKDLRQARLSIGNLCLPKAAFGGNLHELKSSLGGLLAYGGYDVHIYGTGNVVPGITDTGQAKSLLEIFESSQRIAGVLLTEQGDRGVSVSIGGENKYKPMKMLSVVRSSYRIGDCRGAVAVIGPLRMEYPRVMALVEYTSNELTRFLAERGGRHKSAAKRRKRQ